MLCLWHSNQVSCRSRIGSDKQTAYTLRVNISKYLRMRQKLQYMYHDERKSKAAIGEMLRLVFQIVGTRFQ